jgi:hypothetical protein
MKSMKTGCYFTFRGPGRIGITAYPPKNPTFSRDVPMVKALAPRRDMLKLPYDTYRQIFFGEILGTLDAAEIKTRLEQLVAPHEPVLLCYERPPFTPDNWCHRRMVAEWFQDQLGIDVPEFVT